MSFLRFNLDLAIKQPLPAALNERPTPGQLSAMANMTWLQIIREMIRRLKAHSEKIESATNIEETTRAVTHVCRHDEGLSCDPEQEI